MLNIKNKVRSIYDFTMSYPVVKNGICVVSIYFVFLVIYIILQEFYVANCTYRGGIINLFMSMPVCTHTNKALEIIGNQFISGVVMFSGIVMALIH